VVEGEEVSGGLSPRRMRNLHNELRERGDELSLLAAALIESLRAKTAVQLAFTDERTKERVNLFAPSERCFEIAIYDEKIAATLRSIHEQAKAALHWTDFPDAARTNVDLSDPDWLEKWKGSTP